MEGRQQIEFTDVHRWCPTPMKQMGWVNSGCPPLNIADSLGASSIRVSVTCTQTGTPEHLAELTHGTKVQPNRKCTSGAVARTAVHSKETALQKSIS